MSTRLSFLALGSLLLISACATTSQTAAEKNPGRFVTFNCEGNKSFQLRWNPETRTMRYRGHEGGIELTAKDGAYRDDSGELVVRQADGGSIEVLEKGKTKYKGCKSAG